MIWCVRVVQQQGSQIPGRFGGSGGNGNAWVTAVSLFMLGGLLTLALIGFDWITALKSTSGRGLTHGLAQLSGMGSNQSNLLTSLFIHFWPPNVLLHHLLPPWRLAMIYHQLVPPSTPSSPLHFTLLTYHRNLLCHTDLPGLSHSKQTTTHRWSQDVSCPFTQFASA